VSSSTDKGLRVWNIETGKPEAAVKLTIQGGWTAFVPGPNLNSVIVLSNDAKQSVARLWNWRSKESVAMSANFTGLHCLAFAPDGRKLVGGMRDGTIQSWDLADIGRPMPGKAFYGHTAFVEAVAFNPDGRRFASGGADRTFRWWDVESAKQLRSLDAPSGTEKVLDLSFVSDGRLLAITVRSSEIEILQIPQP
jgi:WD40 repeat protein